MKYLILTLCLALVGCAGHHGGGHAKKTPDKKDQMAIQHVMDARRDIRVIISHAPQTPSELQFTHLNAGALIFRAPDFAIRLQAIPLDDCPKDFRTAFGNYVTAWTDRALSSPEDPVLNQTDAPSSGTNVAGSDPANTEAAWEAVQVVCARYGVAAE